MNQSKNAIDTVIAAAGKQDEELSEPIPDFSGTEVQDIADHAATLSALANKFVADARKLGKVIISEVDRPIHCA